MIVSASLKLELQVERLWRNGKKQQLAQFEKGVGK